MARLLPDLARRQMRRRRGDDELLDMLGRVDAEPAAVMPPFEHADDMGRIDVERLEHAACIATENGRS